MDAIDYLAMEVATALRRAQAKHAPMNSPHEGWSVIFEELEELREHVRGDTGRSAEARKEALQVAAMGLRYALDLCADAKHIPLHSPQVAAAMCDGSADAGQ